MLSKAHRFPHAHTQWGGVREGRPVMSNLQDLGRWVLHNLWNGILQCSLDGLPEEHVPKPAATDTGEQPTLSPAPATASTAARSVSFSDSNTATDVDAPTRKRHAILRRSTSKVPRDANALWLL